MSHPVTRPRSGNVIGSAKVAQRRGELYARLLETGAELFVERGIANVSVEDLLAAAGISRATFYGFFANKTELAAAILLPVFDSGQAALKAHNPNDPRAAAERLIDLYLELWHAHRHALLLISQLDAALFAYIAEPHREFGALMQEVLQRIEAAGLLRNGSATLSYLVLAKTGIPLLRLYQQHPDFETIYRESMQALLLKS